MTYETGKYPQKQNWFFKLSEYESHIRESWTASWPMLFIMLFEFLINITDVYIAGKLGKVYQASVGLSYQIYFLFIILANAMTIGSVSLLSRQFSGGEQSRFSESAFTSMATSAAAGIILSAGGFLLSPFIFGFLDIPDAMKEFCASLLSIYCGGLFFHYFLINSNGVLRASRNFKKSMFTMALVCVSNITLNFHLVFNTGLGYRGIALSTALSYALGALINLVHVTRIIAGIRVFSANAAKKIIGIGWPSGLQQVLWNLGFTVLYLIVGSLPSRNIETMAALTNGLRIEAAIYLPAMAFMMSNAVVVGNLLGQKKEREAYASGIITAVIAVGFITALTALVVFNAPSLSGLLSDNRAVMDECVRYIYISMLAEPVFAWAVVISGALNGAGDTKSVFFTVSSGMWLIRLPLCYFLGIQAGLGASAIWWSMNASIIYHAAMVTARYFKKGWMKHAD